MKKTLITLSAVMVTFLFTPNARAEYTDDCITFSSEASFTLKTYNEVANWDGTLWTSTDKVNWTEWNGAEVAASKTADTYNLYVRGNTSNTVITGSPYYPYDCKWVLAGSKGIACSGSIETLRGATGENPSPTKMGDYCYYAMFSRCTSLSSAPVLPATTLADGCYEFMFAGCTSLTDAPALPATTLAGWCYCNMFCGCTSLTSAPALPATILTAEGCYAWMFEDCTSLTSAPELPATTLATGCYQFMFSGCTSLTDVPVLPATKLTYCCYFFMFEDCKALEVNAVAPGKEWKIPATKTTETVWGTDMFSGTKGTLQGQPELNTTYFIASGLLPEGGPYKETIDGIEWTFMVDANLDAIIGANGTAIPQATEGAIVIPSALGGRAVVRIGDWAFSGCSGLASVSIPSSVTYIGFEAFASCSGLTSLMIPASVTVIAPAFTGCCRLNSIEVEPANVNYTSQDGVLFDKNMEAIVKCPNGRQGVYTIPSSVTTVKESAFQGCGGLTSLTIPSSVTSIGNSAFYGCSGLSGLAIPSSVTSIGYRAFYGCSSLTSMTIPSSVKCIGSQVFRECRSLTNISIPSSVVSIGDGAFEDCDSLGSVTIPSSVTSIGDCAFIYCDNLESVTIQSGVASIGSLAFSGCGKLTNLTIPSSVTSIGEWAFSESENLLAMDFEGPPPNGVGNANIKQDAAIRYNIKYATEWLPVIEACGWTNAKAYTPTKITNVTAQQRYPWNGKVDITFAAENAGSEACELFIRATDLTTGKTAVANNVTGDTECTSGLHHVVWDMVADGLTLVSSNVVFSVSYKEQKRPEGLYRVIDLSGGSSATTYPITDLDDVPAGGWGDEYKTTKLVLRRIDPGTCVVTVDKPYYVGVFEVTQKQYELVTGETPSQFSGDVKRPVEYVSYDMIRGSNKGAQYPDSTDVDADSFMGKLRSRTGLHVDLPTEAQWEYAGRAGSTTQFFYGKTADGGFMWYSGNSGSCPHEVGTRKPNAWGIYDVHGNVFERCLEWHSAGLRVLRGGGWFDGDGGCSFYYRAGFDPSDPNDNIGFRLVSIISDSASTETAAGNGVSTQGGCSGPVRIDLSEGTRTAETSETITYSTKWVAGAGEEAVSVVAVNGEVLSETSGSGTVKWTPEYGGTYELTHQVKIGGSVLGGTLLARFRVDLPLPDGGPYKEIVDDIEWTFMVTNGEASVGSGSSAYRAIPESTVGPIVIPATLGGRPVTRIGSSAFWNCRALEGVTISEGVASIGQSAFYCTDAITELDIPSSVTNIEEGAFYACFALQDVNVAEDNQTYFSDDGVLYTRDGTSLVCCPAAKTSVTLLTSVTNVCAVSFGECRDLESITLPPHLATLGDNVFYSCEIKTLTFPSSVVRVGRNMFPCCDSLETVYFEGLPPENIYYEDFLNWQGFDVPARVIAIRYNVAYENEWQALVQERGLTNAQPYQPKPSVPGDPGAVVAGDPENGYTIIPSTGTSDVVVTIPPGVAPDKVIVVAGTDVETVTPNGAVVKIVKGDNDITIYLDVPKADASGTIDLTQATVKQEIVKEALDPEKGAVIVLDAEAPSLTTSETRPGLTYTLHEGASLNGMAAGDSKVGDGGPWTPNITVKGGASGFYSIAVTK